MRWILLWNKHKECTFLPTQACLYEHSTGMCWEVDAIMNSCTNVRTSAFQKGVCLFYKKLGERKMAEGPDPREKPLEELEKEITCAVCHGFYQQAKLLP